MNNKKRFYICLAVGVVALGIFIFGLVSYILSCNFEIYYIYNEMGEPVLDEFGNMIAEGKEFTSDFDFIMIMLGSLILGGAAFYNLYLLYKQNNFDAKINLYALLVDGVMLFAYPLGVFLKALNKALSKGKEFAYLEYQWYLYFAIVGLIITIIGCVFYYKQFIVKKNKVIA